MQKRKLNFKKIFVVILLGIVIIGSFFLMRSLTKPKKIDNKNKIIGEINGYELEDGTSSYYKNIFNDLKTELSKSEINEESYAKIISQLFISDCFTLDNKINNNDVGGAQFVYEPFRDDYISIAKETLYSHVENNIYGNRKQELPIVSNVTIISITKDNYEYLDQEDKEAYFVKASIEYIKDLGYSKEVSLIIIHNNEKLEIVEMK